MRPALRFLEQRGAGFRHDKRPREPQVQRARGDRNVVLDRVACEQFGFKAAMKNDAGFGGAGFTQNKNCGQIAKRRLAGLQSAEARLGFSHQDIDLIAARGPFFRHFRHAVFIESSEPPHGGDESGQADQGQCAAQDPEVIPLQVQPGTCQPSQHQPHHESDRDNPIFPCSVHGYFLMRGKQTDRV